MLLHNILLCFPLFLYVTSLNINCGTRGLDNRYQTQLHCSCDYSNDESYREELFSDIFNPHLVPLSSYVRPVSQKITHIILSNCKTVRVTLDLDRVDRDATELTDVSFEYIENLNIKFRNIVQPRMRFVFTNIVLNQLSGSVSDRSSSLEMFFRQFDIVNKDQTSVTFSNLNMESNIRLLNFQDIGHVRVIDSYFSNIDTLDILHSTKCYTSMDTYTQVTCSKEQLFFAKRYDTTRRPITRPNNRVTDRRPRFEDTTNNYYKTERYSPFYRTIPTSAFNATAAPYAAPVTSSPLFIVPMVLFFAVALIVILVLLFIRYQKRQENMVELLR